MANLTNLEKKILAQMVHNDFYLMNPKSKQRHEHLIRLSVKLRLENIPQMITDYNGIHAQNKAVKDFTP